LIVIAFFALIPPGLNPDPFKAPSIKLDRIPNTPHIIHTYTYNFPKKKKKRTIHTPNYIHTINSSRDPKNHDEKKNTE
jgi:hypothetical protein